MNENRNNLLQNTTATKICIFGTGLWGKNLYLYLKLRNINVDCFCDNNPLSQGYLFDGVFCHGVESIAKEKENILMLLAIKNYADVLSQLKEHEFPHILLKSQVEEMDLGFEVPRTEEYEHIFQEIRKIQEVLALKEQRELLKKANGFSESLFHTLPQVEKGVIL